jgi:hypothetical protein
MVDVMALDAEVTCKSPTPIQSWYIVMEKRLVNAVAGLKTVILVCTSSMQA